VYNDWNLIIVWSAKHHGGLVIGYWYLIYGSVRSKMLE
jgi:hypothetical protein